MIYFKIHLKLFSVLILLILGNIVYAQNKNKLPVIKTSNKLDQNSWPPLDVIILPYNFGHLSTSSYGNNLPFTPIEYCPDDSFQHAKNFQNRINQIISSEKKFKRIFAFAPTRINWKTEQIIILFDYTSYKSSSLNSVNNIIGVAIKNDSSGIIIGHENIYYGVCPNIPSDIEEYSHSLSTIYVVIPKLEVPIEHHTVYLGPDCIEVP